VSEAYINGTESWYWEVRQQASAAAIDSCCGQTAYKGDLAHTPLNVKGVGGWGGGGWRSQTHFMRE